MTWDHKIPFDVDGDMMVEAYSPTARLLTQVALRSQASTYWKPNDIFDATLFYRGYERGRTSARILFELGKGGPKVSMFLRDFDTAMKLYGFDERRMTGTWTYVKRGRHFGIKPSE